MMAPKPQQMQSRNDRLNTSTLRRLRTTVSERVDHGQSLEGVIKVPLVRRAKFQKRCAA